MLIHKHEKCIGIVLWKWKQRFVELWYCPRHYTIKSHSHPQEDIELMYLFGKVTFYKEQNMRLRFFTPRWYHFGQTFSVPAGTTHWFSVSSWPLVFINFSLFKPWCKPKSAAEDFLIKS